MSMIVYYNGGYDLIVQTITNQGFISHSSTKKKHCIRTYVEYMSGLLAAELTEDCFQGLSKG